jgi:uncharacterized protein YxeA
MITAIVSMLFAYGALSYFHRGEVNRLNSYIDSIEEDLEDLVQKRDRIREMLLSSTIASYGSKREVRILTDEPHDLAQELSEL